MLNRPCRKDDFDPLYDRNLNYMNCYILGETLDSHSKFLVGFVMVIFLVFGVVLIVLCLGSNVTWLCELAILDCQFIFLCRLPKYRIVSATDTEWNNTFKSLIHSLAVIYLCIRGMDCGSFYEFDIWFVPTVWHFLFFILLLLILLITI
jgi:hypothetical protein